MKTRDVTSLIEPLLLLCLLGCCFTCFVDFGITLILHNFGEKSSSAEELGNLHPLVQRFLDV